MSAIHRHYPLLLLLLGIVHYASASAICFYRDGSIATADIPCPNSSICCPSGDTCMSNGLCRDKNNHPDGSLTTFSDGSQYNYTGLYYTSSCQDRSFQNCFTQCTTSSSTGDYIWACNNALTSYCCHTAANLGQFDCCSSHTFTLPSPKVLAAQSASPTSSAAPSTATSGSSSTSSTTSSSTTSSSTSQTSTASSAASSTTQSSSPSSSGLSTGAKAGIGVGVSLAALIILALVALLYRAHRKLRGKADGSADKNDETESKGEMTTTELGGRQILLRQPVPQESDGQSRSELEASKDSSAKPVGQRFFELES